MLKKEFEGLMKDTFGGLGKELKFTTFEELALFMEERTLHLAGIVEEPGYPDAVLAERDAIAIKAGIVTTRAGSLVDQRILGVISGALRIAILAV